MTVLESVFLTILRMSLTGGFVIAAILLARLCLKKAPRIFSYCLWAVALFRLCCPVSFESAFSLIPTLPQQSGTAVVQPLSPTIPSAVMPPAATPTAPQGDPSEPEMPIAQHSPLTPVGILSIVWASGTGILLAAGLFSSLRLRGQLKSAYRREGNIYQAVGIQTPFVFGLLRPKIYLPTGLTPKEEQYILLHEQTHIRRRDYLTKALAFGVLCVHWFNPLCWLAFRLMTTDMEMSCDERVLRELGSGIKKEYSSSLLTLAAGRRVWLAGPLAFGEEGVKARIKNVLSYKRPAFWIILVAVAAVAALIAGLAANPRTPSNEKEKEQLAAATSVSIAKVENGEVVSTADMCSDTQLLDQCRTLLIKGRNAVRDSVNDTPDADSWLTFTMANSQDSMTYYLYQRSGKYYLEKPYSFIRRVDQNTYESLTALWDSLDRTMTMDDVRTLAQKGESLSWSDLEGYASSRVDTKFYILRYPLAETGWALTAGSEAPQGEFRYVNLTSPFSDAALDIRTGDLEAFLSAQNSAYYPNSTTFTADLTHDGAPETVTCDFTGIEDGNGSVEISVKNAAGETLWSDTPNTSHAGWMSYSLCTLEGRDYLVYYCPYAGQGAAEYSYQVFSLSSSGEPQILKEDSVFFALAAGPHGLEFEPEEIAQLVEDVNLYLSQGYLLCSTLEGNILFSREDMKVTQLEYLDWLQNTLYTGSAVIDPADSLLDRLKEYQAKVLEPQFEAYGRQVFCDMLHQSIVYENGTLSLTIPERYFPDELTLQVSGRLLAGGGMSWHAFEEESSSGSWAPGKTYSVPIDPAAIDTLTIYMAVPLPDGSTLTRTVTLVPNGNDLTQDFEDEILPGDTASISSAELPIALRTTSYHIDRSLPADVTGIFYLPFTHRAVKWNSEQLPADSLQPPEEAYRVADGAMLSLDFGGFTPDSLSVQRESGGVRTDVIPQQNGWIPLQAAGDETAVYWITAKWENGNQILIAIHVAFV